MDQLTKVVKYYPRAFFGLVVFLGVVLIGACGRTVGEFASPAITEPDGPPHPDGRVNRSSGPSDLVVESDVAALRNANGVSEVSGLEVGQGLRALPDGRYGFSPPWMINTDPAGVIGGTGFDRITLSRSRRGTAVMEVHKSSLGTVYVVGYLSEEALLRVQDQARTAPVSATLFFEPRQARRAVAIPERMIVSSNHRSTESDEGESIYIIELQVGSMRGSGRIDFGDDSSPAITEPDGPPHPDGRVNRSSGPSDLVVESDVAALRNANGVSEVSGLEVGQGLRALPDGRYGFSPPWMINTDPAGVIGGTGFDRITLSRSRRGTAVMEVHKSSLGTVYVVGYLSEEALLRVQDQARTAPVSATLFFEPRQARRAVAIPERMIVSSNHRSTESDEGESIYIIELQVGSMRGSGRIDFGDDSSRWANDGECDDTRFAGDPEHLVLCHQ